MFINEKGFAMPLAIIVTLVVSLLGATLWQYSMSDTLQVERDAQRVQAYYLAKSGADVTIKLMNNRPPQELNDTFYLYGDLNNLNVVVGNYDNSKNNNKLVITVVSDGSSKGMLTSTGNFNGVTKKIEYMFNYNTTGIINGIYK